MQTRLDGLRSKIGRLMQDHLSKQDFNTVTVLSPLLGRVQELQKQADEMDRAINEIETALKSTNGKSSPEKLAELATDIGSDARAGKQSLRVTIDWKANGRGTPPETLFDHTAAGTMVSFIQSVVKELGEDALAKLSRIRINRGPLLSKTPAIDFQNRAQGTLYGNKKLRGTDYYVLTHSSTRKKAEDLNKICRVLGLKEGTVKIEMVDPLSRYL